MDKFSEVTPMMKQYIEVKKQYKDCIVFFRMGDFYEMFDGDAKEASKLLGIALTSRNKKGDNPIPMCGIPHHSHQPYLVKLLNAGKKVAICEQLEDPKIAKGIVRRGVVRVVTPGIVVEDEFLKDANFNFIFSVYPSDEKFYASIVDISTGDIFLKKTKNIEDLLITWDPKEIIVFNDFNKESLVHYNIPITFIGGEKKLSNLLKSILSYYNTTSKKSVGIYEDGFIFSIYLILKHINNMLIDIVLKKPHLLVDEDELYMDATSVRTLELVDGHGGGRKNRDCYTLFDILNNCKTSMGERLLRRWLLSPSRNIPEINFRQEVIEFFVSNSKYRFEIQHLFEGIYDIERIITRIVAKKCNARDLVWLKKSIKTLPDIKNLLIGFNHPVINEIGENFITLSELYSLIDMSIFDEPGPLLTDGGMIKTGYNRDVDELRGLKNKCKNILTEIEVREKLSTGISTLKVKYNKVFGYYFEVPKSQVHKVPSYFERKQTLVGAERYLTDELKELENKILGSEDKINTLEYNIFNEIRSNVAKKCNVVRDSAFQIARLDVLISLSEAAVSGNYSRPEVGDVDDIVIIEGRHPVVEMNVDEPFVPNDVFLDCNENCLSLITGPNMSGKSTYIRMVALIVLMAHIGSYVPAKSAKIGLIDRIFTRIGASDNLSRGESTFMTEMIETANILHNATSRSLIILDEIGRGTSTFDGVSIAWAIAEYILDHIKGKTLFATHYHELTDIPLTHPGAKNYTIEVKEWKNEIIFLRKIIKGSADRSYGIYVAKLAGVPKNVLERSEEILSQLEKNEFDVQGVPRISRTYKKKKEKSYVQPLLIFEENPAIDELRNIDINSITPLQAINILDKLKKKI